MKLFYRFKLLITLAGLLGCILISEGFDFIQQPDQPLPDILLYPSHGKTETDHQGYATVRIEDKEIRVHVVDETNTPVSRATVEAYVLCDKVLVVAGSQAHFPSFRLLSDESFITTDFSGLPGKKSLATIKMTLRSASSAVGTLYDYVKHQEEFPDQIREIVQRDTRVKTFCIEFDAKDFINIGSVLVDASTPFKCWQVFGTLPKIRGVNTIILGYVKARLVGNTVELIVEMLKDGIGILDSDFIKYCFYEYKTEGKQVIMPYATIDTRRIFSESEHELFAISPSASGKDVLIGVVKTPDGEQPRISDIAWDDKAGTLWGISFDRLYRIDPLTGQAYPIGTGLGVDKVNALACDSNGRLFAATREGGLFLSVDKITGSASIVGSYGDGFYSSGDLAFRSDGTLFGSVKSDSYATDVLIVVDQKSGKARVVGEIGYHNVFGLFFMNDLLYGVTEAGDLILIDTTTGRGTFIRKLAFSAWGAQSVIDTPNPSG